MPLQTGEQGIISNHLLPTLHALACPVFSIDIKTNLVVQLPILKGMVKATPGSYRVKCGSIVFFRIGNQYRIQGGEVLQVLSLAPIVIGVSCQHMNIISGLQVLVKMQAVIKPGGREPGIRTLLIIGREEIAAVEQVFAEEIDFIS